MNRKSTPPIPEPIVQLQRQLGFAAPSRDGRNCRSRCDRLQSNWPGNTVCIPWRTRFGWTI